MRNQEKKTVHASEQERPDVRKAREAWLEGQVEPASGKLVFIDETPLNIYGVKTNMARLRSRSARGSRLIGRVPPRGPAGPRHSMNRMIGLLTNHGHWKTTTFLAAPRVDRVEAPLVLDGPINGATFDANVEQFPAPTLQPGDIVVVDNLGSHKGDAARRAIKAGQQTVLIDLDLHHPSVARELDLDVEHCLVDYMLGDAAIDDVIHTTEFGLAVLPVRRQTADPSVLVNSQRLKQLLAAMRERFDYVVVDSPPLLLVTDPKTTSALVDTTVLLVRWQETPADKAANALRELDAVAAKVAGAVLSQVDVKRQAQYGYAGVGSYYGDYKKYYVD